MSHSTLGSLGTKFFAYVQSTGKDTIYIGDLQHRLNLTVSQEHNLLKRLAKNGFILRLKRGVFLVPEKIPTGGHWQPNEYYLIAKYMEIINADYYIGGIVAIHHHKLTTQIPHLFTVYNNKLSAVKQIGKLHIRFIKVTPNRIGGFEELRLPYKQTKVKMANLTRTIIDCVNDWARYNTLPTAYQWIKKRSHNPKFVKELIKFTSKFANKSTLRRIGFILEQCNISAKTLIPLTKELKEYHDWVKLDPNGNFKGKTNKKWGIIINVRNSQ